VLAAGQFAVLLGPVHTAIQRDLGFSTTVLAVAIIVPLVATALGITLGYVLGRWVPVSVVASGLVLMLAGAVVITLSSMPAMFVAAGLVAGLGCGAVLGSAASLTGQVGQRRGQVRLVLGLAVLGGLVAGPLLSWLVTTTLSWRMAYLLAVPMILAVLIATVIGGVVALARGSK
jgi:MFS family permease